MVLPTATLRVAHAVDITAVDVLNLLVNALKHHQEPLTKEVLINKRVSLAALLAKNQIVVAMPIVAVVIKR